jgi:glycosyltransferase involved in cell wall biosynthesis
MMKNVNTCYPFISVIVLVYNASKTIRQLIASLMNQSYLEDKYEIIIVDDGSKDETVEINARQNISLF